MDARTDVTLATKSETTTTATIYMCFNLFNTPVYLSGGVSRSLLLSINRVVF